MAIYALMTGARAQESSWRLMSNWNVPFRLFAIVLLGEVACCVTVAILGILGGIKYQPGATDTANIGSALIFAAILFGALAVGFSVTGLSMLRGSSMARVGVFVAEVLFAFLAVLFFAPVAILFAVVAALALVLLLMSRRRYV